MYKLSQNANAAESARVLVLVTADSDTFTEATVEIASAFLSSLANSTNLTTEVKSLFKLLLYEVVINEKAEFSLKD